MTGMTVAVLLAAACAVTVLQGPGQWRRDQRVRFPGAGGSAGQRRDDATASAPAGVQRLVQRLSGKSPTMDPHELPLFVHQLAGLLRAGRPPRVLWADMEQVHADGRTGFSCAVLPVVARARRAAELGLSVPGALRDDSVGCTGRRISGAEHTDRMWIDLAGCLEVAERSGAPLAGILEHYAAQLDAQLDGLSARDTALAGPRATVVLLAWLPAVGIVLGFALGINPIEVLVASPLGRWALGAGALLMLAGRVWSRRLVQRAGGGTPR
ncbi:hypothetical protein FDK12_13810 [Arthrobacter sp. NamB2]|uniref:type II secretion system F family protein n=1 Tax=Arthrobacter sp. NamB2 TaxID=2576035 RepID=UPI0010CA1A18|nr:hypothetical protein [Arthrobacter sp. NamB2]TKV26444.1 hypothetical protein FDK12_13810 [Arthrobacter sp. NamB2]